MDQQFESEQEADLLLPGFRFHPTDEELVEFYLRRKVKNHLVSMELIKEVDIYRHDPWDLPNLAGIGEKEWYFFCKRGQKYKNSARPNRVTGSGYWKATGSDKQIYSSSGNQCIGLKKSLVYYLGRAANGVKTDWMMHEYRLPSCPHFSSQTSRLPNDSWAICKIYRKTSSVRQGVTCASSMCLLPSLPEAEASTSGHLHQTEPQFAFGSDQNLAFQNPRSSSSSSPSPSPSSSSCFCGLSGRFASAPIPIRDSEGPSQIPNVEGMLGVVGEDDGGFQVTPTGFPVNDAWRPLGPFDLTKFRVEGEFSA